MLFITTPKRRGNYFRTFSGIEFYPFDPRPEEITIEDIAHSLSLQCRFAGHVTRHYSVAEHCVWGSHALKGYNAFRFLLHDATEAYCVDLPRPLKRHGLFGWLYRRVEKRIERAIEQRFAVVGLSGPVIKHVDARMLETEKRDLRKVQGAPDSNVKPFNTNLSKYAVTPEIAEAAYLERYHALKNSSLTL